MTRKLKKPAEGTWGRRRDNAIHYKREKESFNDG